MINCKYQTGNPTWDAIVAQVARMSGMDRFPFDREAKRELCLALCNCHTVIEATRIVDDLVRHEHQCPTPADIRRKIYESRPPEPDYKAECHDCGGTGFIHIIKMGYSGVKDCRCRIERLNAIKEQSK